MHRTVGRPREEVNRRKGRAGQIAVAVGAVLGRTLRFEAVGRRRQPPPAHAKT